MDIVPQKLSNFRTDRRIFSSSDETAMMKKILETHAPDGREIDSKALLHIVEDIFRHAATGSPGIPVILQGTGAQLESWDDRALHPGFSEMLQLLAYTISRISCEISCKCTGGGDAHATALAICSLLSNYTWDAKVVLALAAFSVNFGEFWLVAQLYSTNALARGVAVLKQLPETLEHADSLKPKFEALSNLIKAMLDVTRCIVEFKELPSQYISQESVEMQTASAHIPVAIYWTIRSIVVCASQITGLIGPGHEYVVSTTEAWELSTLAHKINNIHSHLRKLLDLCYQLIEERRQAEAFQALVRLFEITHHDNIKILKALISAKDDQLPLLHCPSKQRVSVDVLRRKNVLLLISDLDIPHDVLSTLEQMFLDSRDPARREGDYEVVWLPVEDRATWNEAKGTQFESLLQHMPWYSLYHPLLLDPVTIRYIREVWHFNKKPLLVVLDPQGKLVNRNAIHMMWIWGSLAFPFTSEREEALWKEESWRIEFLIDAIEPQTLNWTAEGKYICLYGGEDIEWVRRFTTALRSVANAAQIPLEMLYMGKGKTGEKVRKNNAIIANEGLSHTLMDMAFVWYFWERLESMWYSKMQQAKNKENDPIMQEIVTMLSFDGSDQGWAVIGRSPAELAKANGVTILKCLDEFELWKDRVKEIGFVPALNEYMNAHRTPHHCSRLILPGTVGGIPERVVCAECGRPMEKFLMYRCCTE